ncbi:MAG: KOW motif-containing protein [Bacilli bacterium]|nr:KOW motif-containing protein [Bacilli bacterium]
MEKKFNWYIINTFPNSEYNVLKNIQQVIKNNGLSEFLAEIIIPTQEIKRISKKTGLPTGKTSTKILYPGYIFAKMAINNEILSIIRYINGVIGIGGSKNKSNPQPVSQAEMESVFKRMGEIRSSMYSNYKTGDLVKVISGPLKGSSGRIISIDTNTGVCKIETIFFGNLIPANVDFADIEKII